MYDSSKVFENIKGAVAPPMPLVGNACESNCMKLTYRSLNSESKVGER